MERGLNAELTEHLGYEKHATEGRGPGNSGNGSNAKTVSTIGGDVDLAMIASRHPASADFGLMGVATTLIGLLPTYATIGVWALVMLIVLRILQGVSAGGEWGGAALMAVEHAPTSRRGFFGAYPQIGVPLGMLLASAILGLFSLVLTTEQFHAWGWRVPFLVSFVLIFIGYYIRRKVSETPVFQELRDNVTQSKTPLRQLFQDDWKTIIKAALAFAGNNAAGYMVAGGFVLGYVTTTHVNGSSLLQK